MALGALVVGKGAMTGARVEERKAATAVALPPKICRSLSSQWWAA